jgi:hypothetical protein
MTVEGGFHSHSPALFVLITCISTFVNNQTTTLLHPSSPFTSYF